MKNNILYKGMAALVAVASMASCSEDYLNTEPKTSISDVTAVASTKAAQMSIYGISRIMNTQIDRSQNGETGMLMFTGEGLSPDNVSFMMQGEMGLSWQKWESLPLETSSIGKAFWDYNYTVISRANTVLATIDNATGTADERARVKAQALTFRAHGYIHLLQYFAPRWQDSNNGEAYAVILRTKPGSDPTPLGTMNQVLDLIYSDLDEAIKLFKECNFAREYDFEPAPEVAYGLYARAALIKNDWKTARAMAKAAREGYPVASNKDWLSGFINPTSDCMWTNPDNDIYYSSFGSWYSCNGAYPCNWVRGIAINMDLYRQLDKNDIRRKVFFTADKAEEIAKIAGFEDCAGITEADFYDAKNVTAGTMNCLFGGSKLTKLAQGFVKYATSLNPASNLASTLPYCKPTSPTTPSGMQFGASTKMWSTGSVGTYGDSYFPWMRATEMLLTEAEAAYMDGDKNGAAQLLMELNSLRIPGYTAPTGDKILEEIRLSRRIELWCEGHSWNDFKRWNVPVERRVWKEGDATSGNCIANYVWVHQPSDCNGWRLTVPRAESDFNSAFDRSLLNYKE